MMNPERNAAVLALYDCAKVYPQLRLCQIIVNATGHSDPFYVTDDSLAQFLINYLRNGEAANSKARGSTGDSNA
jgi:hypothetical protein